MRGTLKPHTSASSTPTLWPSAASATARFTVTLDFPTPPLPEATAMMAVCGGNAILGFAGAPGAEGAPRSWLTSVSRCSCDMGVSSTSTRETPSSGFTAAVTSCVMRSFSGQPSMVIRTCTRTTSPSTWMSFSMPMSSIGRPISGSMTLRSASRTCSCVTTWLPPGIHLR
jgi:hypothetical protein